MNITDFDYNLPKHQIATHPPKVRGEAKLLVINRQNRSIDHKNYADMAEYFKPGDVLILNDTKVFKARLMVQTQEGETRELLVLEKHGSASNPFQAKVLYRGFLTKNQELKTNNSTITIVDKYGDGTALIETNKPIFELLQQQGNVPLPPYMKRQAIPEDIARYQTVFASVTGSTAAPTASLNFTDTLKQKLLDKGVVIKYLTLHVGLGTFLPIRVEDVTTHKMHQEYFEIPAETIETVRLAKQEGRSITALGTTVTRALEYSATKLLTADSSKLTAISGEADIFIFPGYQFKVINRLITNFHAPRSTVLMLTASFTGWELLQTAYQQAIDQDYRFLSYGDTCLIL